MEGTYAELKDDHRKDNVADITLYPGPVRAILLLYWGRRRKGDVAHFAELAIPTLGTKAVQLVVCVVDIVHGSRHDISKGGTKFWEPQLRAGTVAAMGAAPPCETWSIARFADCEGIGSVVGTIEHGRSPCALPGTLGVEKTSLQKRPAKFAPPTSSSSTQSFLPLLQPSLVHRCGQNIQIS